MSRSLERASEAEERGAGNSPCRLRRCVPRERRCILREFDLVFAGADAHVCQAARENSMRQSVDDPRANRDGVWMRARAQIRRSNVGRRKRDTCEIATLFGIDTGMLLRFAQCSQIEPIIVTVPKKQGEEWIS